ncbi:MAG: ATP-binding protein [Eggerthellaceae bacterium]|nr:ATP-binding protein [Eggerthellaceae bacterium]
MATYINPFTPVFGNEPPVLAGRTQLIEDVLQGLENGPGDPNRITIFTGPRGSGKTVLLSTIAARAEAMGWISVHVAASNIMLDQLIEQIERKASSFISQKPKSGITGVQISGTGLQRKIFDEKKKTWRAQMDEYLDMLADQEVGLLFSIDEVSAEFAEMVEFVSTFQFFIREKRNVALIMAGLPSKVMQMFQSSSISFLRRSFHRSLDAISYPEVRATMKKTVELAGRAIEADALKKAAESTRGLAFMIQLVGYHAFNQSSRKTITEDDVGEGISDAKYDMENMILGTTLFELSDTDRRFLMAMLQDEETSTISDIARRMETSSSNASHYKRRLINQGIVADAGRGKVAFGMPMMREMLVDRYSEP